MGNYLAHILNPTVREVKWQYCKTNPCPIASFLYPPVAFRSRPSRSTTTIRPRSRWINPAAAKARLPHGADGRGYPKNQGEAQGSPLLLQPQRLQVTVRWRCNAVSHN